MEEKTDIGMDAVLAAAGRRLRRVWPYAVIALAAGLIPALAANWLVRRFAPLEVIVWVRPPLYMEIWASPHGVALLFIAVFVLFASAATVHFALNDRGGKDGDGVAAAIATAARRLPVLLVSLLQLMVLFGLLFIVMRWPKGYSLTFLVNLVGSVFVCRYAAKFGLFVPVCMAEDVSLFAGLARSARLSRGRRGVVFLLLLVSAAGTLAVASLVFLLADGPPDPVTHIVMEKHGAFVHALYNLLGVPWLLFWAVAGTIVWNVANAMLYRRLRALERAEALRTGLPSHAEI